ncbi:O-antigen ligase family protein [Paenibacillus solisilvae]|uniref:O-antigen ligase family protein n=1 Tax=Paenibacillus solisilvae TaxID=2486751 RepID=A0ABW0W6X9_9BACL
MSPKKLKSSLGLGIAALLTALALGCSAFVYGMFFDENFYRLEGIILFAVLLLIAIKIVDFCLSRLAVTSPFASLGLADIRMPRFTGPVLGLVLIAILYLSSLLHEPASVQSTIKEAIRWSVYAAYMWLIALAFGSESSRIWLSAALQAAGAFVIWGALAGWMGWISFPGIVMITGDPRLSAVGARLSGFVQYPNFLGAAMSAYLVWFWLLLVRTRSNAAFWFAAMQTVPAMLVVLLTESRGAWLAAALSWMIALALVSKAERSSWLLYSGWTLLAAGTAYRFVVRAGAHSGNSFSISNKLLVGAVFLLALMIAALAGYALLRRLITRETGNRRLGYYAWSGGAAAIMFTLLLLPADIHGRVGSHFQTAAARKLFYTDALMLIKKNPLLGHGGDSWRMQFTQIQTQPYVGTEVHSGYLDLLLDVGIIGCLLFLLVLALMAGRVWLYDRAGLLPVIALLAHASIDFDMSYGYYWLLLLSWVVLYSRADGAKEDNRQERLLRQRFPINQAAAVLLAAAVFTVSGLYSWRFDRSVQYRESALAASGTARAAALRAALETNPYWSRIRIELAKLAPPQERAALLAAGLRYEPQSVPLLWELGSNEAELGRWAQAADCMRAALRLDRFNRDKQSVAVVTMTRLAQQLRADKQQSAARQAAEQAVAFYQAYEAQTHYIKINGREFYVTQAAKEAEEESQMIFMNLLRP